MKKIDVDLGLEEYEFGKAVIRLNPRDMFLGERLANAIEKLEGMQNKLIGQVEATNSYTEKYNLFKNASKDMKKVIDDVFDQPGVSNDIFCGVSPHAMGENSIPVWANVLVPLAAEIRLSIKDATAEDNPKLKAYTEKYAEVFE